ncbi:hypothetical protein F4X10_03730 [Candidatus Poribacteria bacterium]|nr:hypothetical protein [Candidatus Poribacteria bacterium]
MITYAVGNSGEILILTDEVLDHFNQYRQLSTKSKEAGGQLFACFNGKNIAIKRATGPRYSDRRSYRSFVPNRIAERREIKRLFRKGLHYVGDWHTHPEPQPQPSKTDIRSFQNMFWKSRHQLARFVMIIVGTAETPRGLYVAAGNRKELIELTSQ